MPNSIVFAKANRFCICMCHSLLRVCGLYSCVTKCLHSSYTSAQTDRQTDSLSGQRLLQRLREEEWGRGQAREGEVRHGHSLSNTFEPLLSFKNPVLHRQSRALLMWALPEAIHLRHQLLRVLKSLIKALQSEYVIATLDSEMKTACSSVSPRIFFSRRGKGSVVATVGRHC